MSATRSATGPAQAPEARGLFWVRQIITICLGATASDVLTRHCGPALVGLIATIALTAALLLRRRSRRSQAGSYWTTFLLIGVLGTTTADGLHTVLGLPYAISTALLALALGGVLALQRNPERDAFVHGRGHTRQEGFHWAAAFTIVALGIAAGDLSATVLGLGSLDSALLFLGPFVTAVFVDTLRPWRGAAFWTAYVLSPPLSASLADWFLASHNHDGLALGTAPVCAALLLVLLRLTNTGNS